MGGSSGLDVPSSIWFRFPFFSCDTGFFPRFLTGGSLVGLADHLHRRKPVTVGFSPPPLLYGTVGKPISFRFCPLLLLCILILFGCPFSFYFRDIPSGPPLTRYEPPRSPSSHGVFRFFFLPASWYLQPSGSLVSFFLFPPADGFFPLFHPNR